MNKRRSDMIREQQDKLWNDLGEERQKTARELYKYITRPLDPAKSNAQTEANMMAFSLETTFGSHNLNSKTLTYEDVANTLFGDKKGWIIDRHDVIKEFDFANCGLPLPFNATSKKQLEKLGAINKLLNVAKYLNGDWKPDWENEQEAKWYIEDLENEIDIDYTINCNSRIVYFRTEELAKQAIQILGEETIRLALSTDY